MGALAVLKLTLLCSSGWPRIQEMHLPLPAVASSTFALQLNCLCSGDGREWLQEFYRHFCFLALDAFLFLFMTANILFS